MTLLCVLLLGGASTAQACHMHGSDAGLTKSSPVNVPTDHCPLCQAMHTAMPVAVHIPPVLVESVSAPPNGTRAIQRSPIWSFSLFSRPPPARWSGLMTTAM